MSISQLIEVAIGLAVVYYILGLIVSFLSSRILESLETRGKALEAHLKKLVGDAKLGELLEQPQIKSLKPIRYDGWRGAITGKLKEAKLERIPISNLVDAVFDIYGLIDKDISADALKDLITNLPDSEAKTNLLKLIDQKVTDINQLRAKTEMWITGLMDQAAAAYKAHARQFVIGLSLVVTLLFGVDTIDFAGQLWHDADLRTIANAKAELYLQSEGATADIGPLLSDLGDLSLRIGWWSVPANIPQNGEPTDWIIWTLKKILGLGITVLAVSQGSSFWYDALRQLRGANTRPTEASKSSGESTAEK